MMPNQNATRKAGEFRVYLDSSSASSYYFIKPESGLEWLKKALKPGYYPQIEHNPRAGYYSFFIKSKDGTGATLSIKLISVNYNQKYTLVINIEFFNESILSTR